MSMIDKNFKIDLRDLIHKKDLLSGQIAQGHWILTSEAEGAMQWVHEDPCLFSLSTIGLSNKSNNTIRITPIEY